ncbi:MAG: CPBP family intramembrane glutamic endopeptidase [Bacteriovorax sp.]
MNPEAAFKTVAVDLVHEQETIIKKSWAEFKPLLILYTSILFIIFISSVSREAHPVRSVIDWTIIFGLTIYFGYIYKDYLKDLFKLHKFSFKIFLEILALAAIVLFFIKIYFYSFKVLHFETAKTTSAILLYKWPIWSAFVLTSVCPGILEEIIFRGIIYSKFKDIFDVKEALIIQAACFSVLHLSPLIFISHFTMGLFLGWVRECTKTLYFSMLFHMAWNAYVVWQELYKIRV